MSGPARDFKLSTKTSPLPHQVSHQASRSQVPLSGSFGILLSPF